MMDDLNASTTPKGPLEQKPTWQETALQMREYRDESIVRVSPPVPKLPEDLPLDVTSIPRQLLSEEEVRITELLPEELLSSLASGHLTSVAVTTAFLRRAGLAQRLTNCITELLPESALERAKYLDDYYAERKKPIGPLHGLPISLKEHVPIRDLDVNCGFVGYVGRYAHEDATILQHLRNAGAVFYVRTTEPQTVMHLETSNNIYGETVNPFNRKLTSGGSSGGEGALLGLRGSCLGIGTDIGGSIRNPAHNCGVFGLRPTSYRIPMDGLGLSMEGMEGILCVAGPLSTSLEGIKIFMKSVIDRQPWLMQPSCLPFPWRDQQSWLKEKDGRKKLKVAVMWDDGVVRPHPPVQRALKEVVEKLKAAEDIEVVDWKPYRHDYAWEIISHLFFPDGGEYEAHAIELSGEPWRPLSTWVINDNPHVSDLTVAGLWEWTQRREDYRTAYSALWNSTVMATPCSEGGSDSLINAVDVILCPAGPGAAGPLNQAKYWGYTSQWNLLDYPALVFPVTKVDPEVDVVEQDYEPRNEDDEFNHKLYEPAVYKNAPVGLQLVGRRYEDEKVILALEFVQERIGVRFGSIV